VAKFYKSMSYQVSARKWRPQNFSEVIGQVHVVKTLKNAILNNRVGHAYLFSGSRGIGKTTIARIFAKALNCDKGPTPEPCNNCEMCREITGGFCSDVIEIDGASNTSVEDVREIRENVKYSSAKGRYKIYIVDEVHMLSKSAFNAFLKTLEEPPAHIVFIFATTEPNKIPETIISRCQYFEFKKLSLNDTIEQLVKIAKMEGIEISREILTLIAKTSEGSMRDALVSLDQIVSFGSDIIKEDDVKMVLGLVGRDVLRTFFDSILKKDIQNMLSLVKTLSINGTDLRSFCKEFLEYIRDIMVVKITADPTGLVDFPLTEVENLKFEAEKISIEELQYMFSIILKTETEIKYVSQPILALEMALIKMTQIGKVLTIDEILKRLDSFGQKNTMGELSTYRGQDSEESPAPEMSVSTAEGDDNLKLWGKIKESISAKKPMLGGVLEDMKLSDIKGDEIVLNFTGNSSESFYRQTIESNQGIIKETIREVMGKDFRIIFEARLNNKSSKGNGIEKWKKEKIQEVLDIIPGVVLREINVESSLQ